MYRFLVVLLLSFVLSAQSRLSCKQIRTFVDGHNSRRLQLANGDVPDQPAASQMNYIIWDEELAAKASKWASRNEFEHNPDRSLGSNRFTTGENIYWTASSDLTYKFDPNTALDSWFNEYKDYTFGPLTTEQFQAKKMIGHYTQMAWSDSIYLGCGVSKAFKNGMINYYAVCNYGPAGNYLGQTPYPIDDGPSGYLTCSVDDCERKYGDKC